MFFWLRWEGMWSHHECSDVVVVKAKQRKNERWKLATNDGMDLEK